jgi:hypothetical protein
MSNPSRVLLLKKAHSYRFRTLLKSSSDDCQSKHNHGRSDVVNKGRCHVGKGYKSKACMSHSSNRTERDLRNTFAPYVGIEPPLSCVPKKVHERIV